VVGVHWGLYRKVRPAMFDQTQAALDPLIRTGQVDPVISEVVPLEDAPAALARLGDRGTWGKVVLRIRA
jgi:NADPH2:quinone reductase